MLTYLFNYCLLFIFGVKYYVSNIKRLFMYRFFCFIFSIFSILGCLMFFPFEKNILDTEFPLYYDILTFLFIISYSTLFFGIVSHFINKFLGWKMVILSYLIFLLMLRIIMRVYPFNYTLIMLIIGLPFGFLIKTILDLLSKNKKS